MTMMTGNGRATTTKLQLRRCVTIVLALALAAGLTLTGPAPQAVADPPPAGNGFSSYPVPDAANRNLGEIPASAGFGSLAAVAASINNARAVENADVCPGGACEPGAVVMPTNFSFPAGYATWTPSAKGLYILNSERTARGLMPFADVNSAVETTAQQWASHLAATGSFNHRPNVVAAVQANCTGCAGNLGTATENIFGSFGSGATYAIEEAMYLWMYMDRTLGGALPDQNWGHRVALLLNIGVTDDWGPAGAEGFVGFGLAVNGTTTIVVWNAVDSNAAWPVAPPGYTPLNPTRLYDSRVAFGPWAANETRSIQVRGLAGIPANATAVVVHVTSVTPTADTFITAWASGQPQPTAASKNLGPGTEHTQITNDLLIVPIGTDGRINIFNNLGTTHLVFDVVGYFSPTGDQYSTLNPTRLYDSRIAFGPWAPNETRSIQVRGLAGIPANATAVVVHVTSVTPTADTFITAWASGQPQPTAASKNLGPGTEHTQITNDLLIVPIGTDGRINIFNNLGTTHLVFDVVGYFSPTGDQYSTLNPTRLYDSRIAFGPWAPNETRSIQVRGLAGIPANATAVVVHVTSVTPTADTFITAWASGQPQPTAASKNLGPGNEHTQITNDLLIVPIGTDGRINIFNNLGTTHLVFDVVGYFG